MTTEAKASAERETTAGHARSAAARRIEAGEPRLLSGGNPEITKGYGDEPVQAYIAGMPGWKSAVGRRLDALIVDAVPHVKKAVKWNSPLYGIDSDGWLLGIHCLAKYFKIALFRGVSLKPVPPVSSKTEHARYFHIHEHHAIDEAQFAGWVRQASRLPAHACRHECAREKVR